MAVLVLSVSAGLAQAQLELVDVSAERGIKPYRMELGMGGGVAAADVDGDGDVDIFVPNAEGKANQLYLNLGGGQFQEIAAAAGLASLGRARVALWLDYDGDSRLDLFTASDCFAPEDGALPWEVAPDCLNNSSLKLYRQLQDLTFVEVADQAGLSDDQVFDHEVHRGGLSAGDVNGDGYLDLLVGLWGRPEEGSHRLFLNHGDGTFSDVTESSGIIGQPVFAWQPMMHDFDGDGWLDIYSAIDFDPNALWINQGGGGGRISFVDVAPVAGADNAWNDMGLSLGDFDNDRDLDLYVTNIYVMQQGEQRHNLLLRNDSDSDGLRFTRLSAAGVENGHWGWGTTFFDADNDGDLDLASTNGFFYSPWDEDPSRFFLNQGGDPVAYVDVAAKVGFDDTLWGSSLLAFDFDRDGDLDLVQTCNGSGGRPHAVRLLENQPGAAAASNHFLVVQPRMSGPNHRAIGAVVRVEAGGLELMRLISAGTSFFGQEPAEAFFGLGAVSSVDRVTVEWPDGTRDSVFGVDADRVLVVSSSSLFADGFERGDTSAW